MNMLSQENASWTSFDVDKIYELLADENEYFRLIGIELLAKRKKDETVCRLLREALYDKSCYIRLEAAYALRNTEERLAIHILVQFLKAKDKKLRWLASKRLTHLYPPLVMEQFPGFDRKASPYSAESSGNFRLFKDQTRHAIEQEFEVLLSYWNGTNIPKFVLNELAFFPGQHNYIRSILRRAFSVRAASEFMQICEAHKNRRYRKQLTLALTYECNIRCSYCYAGNHWSNPKYMTHESLTFILNYLESQDCRVITFTGGEPTLHPCFGEFLEMVRNRGFTCYFTTNSLFSREVLASIRPEVVKIIGIHVNENAVSSEGKMEVFLRNIKGLRSTGVPLYLRYNMFPGERVKDWSFLLRLCEENDIRQVNFAMPFPNSGETNKYVSPKQMNSAGGTLVKFVKELEKLGVKAYPAKPLPLCIFSGRDRQFMIEHDLLFFGCTVHHARYTHNLVVNPDLTVMPCIGLPTKGPTLNEFTRLENAGEYFREVIHELQRKPLFDKCLECQLYNKGQCVGACLAYKHLKHREL